VLLLLLAVQMLYLFFVMVQTGVLGNKIGALAI
jgi:hypothetical protein